MSVSTVRDDRLNGDRRVGMRPPRIESRALRHIQRIDDPGVRHRPPSQREILGHQGSKRIESIAFVSQNPGRNVVVGARRQRPPAMRDCGNGQGVSLQRLLLCNLPIGWVHSPVFPLAPAVPQREYDQAH